MPTLTCFPPYRALSVALGILAASAAACGRRPLVLEDGGIYSTVTDTEKGTYGIVKVLKVEPEAVHVRLYGGEFKERPTSVDPSELKLGTIHEGAMGHLPLSHRVFASWKPVLIAHSKVDPSELDGYREWKEAKGGVWDK